MLKYIIAVTNSALPLMLVLGVFFVLYAHRMGPGVRKALWGGFWLGAAASVVLGLLKQHTGFGVREYYNLAVLLPTLSVEAAMTVLLWLPKKNPLSGTARAAFGIVSFLALALWVGFTLPDILFFPFDFAVGMDTIFNTRCASKVIGYALGILLVLLAHFATASIFRQLTQRAVTYLFQAVLLVFAARQLLTVLQIVVGRNLVERTAFRVRVVIDGLNHAEWFLFVLMTVCAVCAVVVYLRNRYARPEAPNPALVRKLRAVARSHRRWCAVLAVVFVTATLSVTVGAAYENQAVVLEPPLEVAVRDGKILLPLPMIDDGKLHRFRHEAPDGTEIRYIVIKKNETAFGVGLDACDICGPSGYYERNDQVICILCDVVMNMSTIGFPGGCKPVPLAFRVEDGHMHISVEDLERDLWRFKE
ncbi:MAG: Fe-S-containing protein [Planctomycetes bacterium]|nr:Fe-S-containing protein [Planctomycetota bacterium]